MGSYYSQCINVHLNNWVKVDFLQLIDFLNLM